MFHMSPFVKVGLARYFVRVWELVFFCMFPYFNSTRLFCHYGTPIPQFILYPGLDYPSLKSGGRSLTPTIGLP